MKKVTVVVKVPSMLAPHFCRLERERIIGTCLLCESDDRPEKRDRSGNRDRLERPRVGTRQARRSPRRSGEP